MKNRKDKVFSKALSQFPVLMKKGKDKNGDARQNFMDGAETALCISLDSKPITKEILEKNGIALNYKCEYDKNVNTYIDSSNYPIEVFKYGDNNIFVSLTPKDASFQVTSLDGKRYVKIEKTIGLTLLDLQDAIDFCGLNIELKYE